MSNGADFLLAGASKRPLPELDAPVRAALRLGVHQLLAGVVPHAAVGTTVGALAGWSSPAAVGAKQYANAVLRRIADLGPNWAFPDGEDAEALSVRTSHPRWLVELLRRDLGAEAEAVLASANVPPAVTLRPNRLRATPEELIGELTAGGVRVEAGSLAPGALVVRGVGDLARLPAVAEGRATPQDQASQAVADAVGARPGECILDLAAAPGGKATAMAEAMADDGLVVAADLRPGRAGRVRQAALRLGLRSVQVVAADGRRLPIRPAAGHRTVAGPTGDGRFDRVLLDAPCSGLGVLRRRPEARWRLDPVAIDRAAALQRELLTAAAGQVRPGGLLAYSVCTLTREETLDIDDWAAAACAGFTALDLPSAAGTDGMFLLLLRAPA